MKISKRKMMLIGLAATTLFSTKGCEGPDAEEDPDRGRYEAEEDDVIQNGIPVEDNQLKNVYGPPIDAPVDIDDGPIDPGNNMEPDVYGPPADIEEEPMDPGDNLQPLVYGPPEWFEDQGNAPEGENKNE